MKRIIVILTLILPVAISAQNRSSQMEYIDKYKNLAIEHMRIYKIPASIKLAQALIESGNGKSALARQENNHFGIKAGRNWQGEVAYYDDDKKGEPFRKYKTAEESFEDHSKLLSQAARYKVLFELEITDYKGWAHGLKAAGYATLPTYADVLINTIEVNNLQHYDIAGVETKQQNEKPAQQNKDNFKNKPDKFGRDWGGNNGVKYVVAKRGDTFEQIAKDQKIRVGKLLRLNDLERGATLKEGDMVYIEPKKDKSIRKTHRVKVGDSTHSISQQYGVKIKALVRRNPDLKKRSPMVGEEIILK